MTTKEKVNLLEELIKEKKNQIEDNKKSIRKGYQVTFYMKWNKELEFQKECYREYLIKTITQYS